MYLKIDYFILIAIIGLQLFRPIFFRSSKVSYFIFATLLSAVCYTFGYFYRLK